MTALDRLLQLQQQGLSEQQMANALQQEGFSMKEINDSMNQARIKSAVSQEPEQNNGTYQENVPTAPQDGTYPTPQNTISGEYSQENYPAPQEATQQYQNYAPQQEAGGYYQNPEVTNTETMTDIVEQVMAEKTNEIMKKIESLDQIKNSLQREVGELKERLKRIEANMDTIQKAIIGRIGEFGESTKMVQRDLENIHGTMSKMMNPLIDNYNELKKFNSKKSA